MKVQISLRITCKTPNGFLLAKTFAFRKVWFLQKVPIWHLNKLNMTQWRKWYEFLNFCRVYTPKKCVGTEIDCNNGES